MKKTVLFIVLVLGIMLVLGGCGSSSSPPKPKFNPPTWIQGEWADECKTNKYQFTSDNILFTADSVSLNFKELYKDIAVDETVTSTLYQINFNTGSVYDTEYKFEKKTDTSLNYSSKVFDALSEPVELIKQ